MRCPYCNHSKLKVTNKRESDSKSIRRRRECLKCHKRFTTYERVELIDLIVLKKNGSKEQFNRDKLKAGIERSCEKSSVSEEVIERMVESIEENLRKRSSTEIPSAIIGALVIRELKKVDKVAYIRFASVYKEFKDVDDFKDEIKILVKR